MCAKRKTSNSELENYLLQTMGERALFCGTLIEFMSFAVAIHVEMTVNNDRKYKILP